jgi:hypothetical protein
MTFRREIEDDETRALYDCVRDRVGQLRAQINSGAVFLNPAMPIVCSALYDRVEQHLENGELREADAVLAAVGAALDAYGKTLS